MRNNPTLKYAMGKNIIMSFRKEKTEWSRWIRKHQSTLQDIGIPEKIYSKETRWLIFLEHAGYDEYDYENRRNAWSINDLTKIDQKSFTYSLLSIIPKTTNIT